MKIAFDLDGTITEAPEFFSKLSHLWDDNVYVITYREDYEPAAKLLEMLNINFTELILVRSFDEKAEVIDRLGIEMYFDDMPEMLKNVSEDVGVCLFRNAGNFDFDDKKWVLSDKTAKVLYE